MHFNHEACAHVNCHMPSSSHDVPPGNTVKQFFRRPSTLDTISMASTWPAVKFCFTIFMLHLQFNICFGPQYCMLQPLHAIAKIITHVSNKFSLLHLHHLPVSNAILGLQQHLKFLILAANMMQIQYWQGTNILQCIANISCLPQ